jgi:hypothetical protein
MHAAFDALALIEISPVCAAFVRLACAATSLSRGTGKPNE